MKQNKRKLLGVTLIEMMIAVAILALLSAVAYPGLVEYMNRGKRTDVRALLMENAQYMERFYTENSSYLISTGGAAPVLPNLVSPKNASGSKIQYNLRIAANAASTYELRAEPVNSMASDPCGKYVINQLGQRKIVDLGSSKTEDTCWNK